MGDHKGDAKAKSRELLLQFQRYIRGHSLQYHCEEENTGIPQHSFHTSDRYLITIILANTIVLA